MAFQRMGHTFAHEQTYLNTCVFVCHACVCILCVHGRCGTAVLCLLWSRSKVQMCKSAQMFRD